jgi:hypothetical protein
LRLDTYQDYTVISRYGWYNAIGNIGGMQGFIAMVIGMLIGNFTGVDFMTTMFKGLFLKKQPSRDFIERYTMKGHKLSMMDAIALKLKLEGKKNKVQASLKDGDVDKEDL